MPQGLHSYVWPVATVLVEVESTCIIAAEGSTAQRWPRDEFADPESDLQILESTEGYQRWSNLAPNETRKQKT